VFFHGSTGIKFIKLEYFKEDNIVLGKCLFIDEETHNKELKRSILK
jgi:type I restriction enzyme S subunit